MSDAFMVSCFRRNLTTDGNRLTKFLRVIASLLIAFENTSGRATGIAVNSVSVQQVSVPVIVRDDACNQIDDVTPILPAKAHTSLLFGGRQVYVHRQ
jgi:hypothetical protein